MHVTPSAFDDVLLRIKTDDRTLLPPPPRAEMIALDANDANIEVIGWVGAAAGRK